MKATPSPREMLIALLRLNSTLERRSESFFQPYGVTGAQFNILNLLAEHGDSMDQAALVDLLLVGKSSVSIVINRMVRNGLIRRQEHAKDRRQTVLFLTAEGRARWTQVLPVYEAGVAQIFSALKKSHTLMLMESLETLESALLQSGAATAPGK